MQRVGSFMRQGVLYGVVLAICCSCVPQETLQVSKENELKFVLTEAGYKILLAHFEALGTAETATQSNYYFDARPGTGEPFLLKKNGINVRLRTKGTDSLLTVKVGHSTPSITPSKTPSLFRSKAEYECYRRGGRAVADQLGSGDLSLFTDIANCEKTERSSAHPLLVLEGLFDTGFRTPDGTGIFLKKDDLGCVGGNRTVRTPVSMSFGGFRAMLELDKTFFPEDYRGYTLEAEIEAEENEETVAAGLKQLLADLNVSYKPSQAGKQSITYMILMRDLQILSELERYGSIHKTQTAVWIPCAP